jgi:hypothetical protein
VIYLVRHGEPEAGWNAHQDPGLSDLGRRQAGWTRGDEGIVYCQPLPGSLTMLERVGDTFRVVEGAAGASALL